ncbi:MAG: fimbrillin family protein [Dysgonomonas sp.]|uniref:fimbrillin family protein n=1 Tax=Dysgonomonas sp. TaxID=1891233 RepID=UPI003A83C704
MGKTAIFSKLTGGLPLLAAAIVFTGCSEEQQSGVNLNATGREIAFRALDTRPAKAATTTARTLTSFTISGIKSTATSSGDILMDAVAVVRSSTDGTWEYSPKALWPDAADLYAFYAYSPANSRNVDPAVTFKGNLDHKLKYTVPTDAGAQEDFLVAIQERAANGTGPVSLNFKHALSRVLVNARAAASLDGFGVTVKKVTFKNLVTSGTLVLAKEQPASTGNPARTISTGWPMDASGLTYASYTEAEVSDVSFAPAYLSHTTGYENFWQQGTARDSYPVDIRPGGVRISGGGDSYSPLTGELGALMVMPQRTQCSVPTAPSTGLDTDFYVEIEYSLNGSDHTACKAVGDYWTRGFNASGDGFVFEPGKAYEFNIVIGDGQGPRFVGLDVNEVAGWETNPGIEVPRPEEGPKNYVEINGIKWAKYNVDAPNTFVANETDYGMFYKFGGTVGWSSTNPLTNTQGGTTWDNSATNIWPMTTQNPCPDGWQVPTSDQLADLAAHGIAWFSDYNSSGVAGQTFSDGGEVLFCPAAGRRYYGFGSLYEPGNHVYLWSRSTTADLYLAFCLWITESQLSLSSPNKIDALSVRCIKI